MAEQIIELQPGEAKLVSFEAVPQQAKTYQVSVDGLSGSFIATKVPTTVAISLKNAPGGSTAWQLILYDQDSVRISSQFGLDISAPAVFDIPPDRKAPFSVDMLIYAIWNGAAEKYRMQSHDPSRSYYKDAFIPGHGSYYFNVATEQFERIG